MMKKAGLVVAGIGVALLAATPFALATDEHHEPGGGCGVSAAPGDASNESLIEQTNEQTGGGAQAASNAAAAAQSAVGGGNAIGNIGNCATFLNDNIRDNVRDNFNNNTVEINVGGEPAIPTPAPPA